MKRAQMEILGLAFLFVLIIFGFLLYYNLASKKAFTKETKEDYMQPKMASAFGDMLLHTTVHCEEGDRSLRELFIDCMSRESGSRVQCSVDKELANFESGNPILPLEWGTEPEHWEPLDSCKAFALFAKIGGNITLQKWAEPYYVEAYIRQDITDDDLDDDIEIKLEGAINHAEPLKGIEQCESDPSIRSRRSRNQPLPLLDGRVVTMRIGICY